MRVVAGTLAGVLLLASCASFRAQHPRAAGTIGGAIAVSVFYGGMQSIEKDDEAKYFAIGAVAGAVVGYVIGYEFERSQLEDGEPAAGVTFHDEPEPTYRGVRRRWRGVPEGATDELPPAPPAPPSSPPLDPPLDPPPDVAPAVTYHELGYDLTSPARRDADVSDEWFGRGGHGVARTVARACADALVDATDQLRAVCTEDLPYAGVGEHTVDRSACACSASADGPVECHVVLEASCELAGASLVLGVGSSDSRTVASADAIADARARCATLGGTDGDDLDTSCHCDPYEDAADTAACTCLAQVSCAP